MTAPNRELASQTEHDHAGTASPKRKHTVLNWALALTTVLGAAAVVGFAFLQVLGTAGCSDRTCPQQGPGEFMFGLIIYRAPLVAVLAIGLSFITAQHRRGSVVPLCAWAVLVLAFAVLVLTF